MANDQHPLSEKEFWDIYKKVPRLTVEIIVRENGKIFLTERAIEPCKGTWHLPGGTVRMGEPLVDAVKRVALREIGIRVEELENKGYIEYPDHYKAGLGYPVGIVFQVTHFSGVFRVNNEAAKSGWFEQCPPNMHPHQDTYLINNGYLKRR